LAGKCVPAELYRKPAVQTNFAADYVAAVTGGRRSGGSKEGLRKYQNFQIRINITRAIMWANLILVAVFFNVTFEHGRECPAVSGGGMGLKTRK